MQHAWIAAALVLATGCVPRTGRLESNRYQHEEHPYAVFYGEDGSPSAPLGGAWQVENFTLSQGKYLPKNAPEFMVERGYDLTGDGQPEARERVPFYDLLLTQARGEDRMWVRTVPLSSAEADSDLRMLAERYVSAASHAANVAAPFGTELASPSTSVSATPNVLHMQPCALSKRDALRVDFELTTGAPTQTFRGSVVLVRTGYGHRVAHAGIYKDFPVLMLVGLSTRPERAAVVEPDFERLLKQTVLGELGRGLSMRGSHTCGLAGPTSGGEGELSDATEAPSANEEAALD
jgi:hypothetical protein